MRYLDKTFFKFLFGLLLMLALGLFFVSKVSAALVNINTATKQELDDSLPGVGPSTAQSIIDNRPYASIQEISRADGIGEPGTQTYENVINLITVGASAPAPVEDQGVNPPPGGILLSSEAEEEKAPAKDQAIKVGVESEKRGAVGVPIEFRASVSDKSARKLHMVWSFGDGAVAYGQNVSHAYAYPGNYIAVFRLTHDGETVTAKTEVSVVLDSLSISMATQDRVEVLNGGKTDVDLYGREIYAEGKHFAFPEDTIIKAGQRVSFPSSVTGLVSFASLPIIAIAGSKPDTEPKLIARETNADTSEIEKEILSAQVKLMELKRAEAEREAEAGLANAISALDGKPLATSTEPKKGEGWLSTIKRFFGFK